MSALPPMTPLSLEIQMMLERRAFKRGLFSAASPSSPPLKGTDCGSCLRTQEVLNSRPLTIALKIAVFESGRTPV